MLKYLIILLTLTTLIHSNCDEGCLRCDNEFNLCKFCDVTKNLKTVHGRCLPVIVYNCELTNYEGICLYCDRGYTLDTWNNVCVPNIVTGKKFGCDLYNGEDNCRECDSGFHLTNSYECIQVGTVIPNCFMYLSQTQCAICDKNFQLTVDQTKCEAPPSISNCGGFSSIRCMSCREGYKYNHNNYLYSLFNFTNMKNVRLVEKQFKLDVGNAPNQYYSVCQKLDMDNCEIHSSFNECSRCVAGYYLYENTCHAYPLKRIRNCEKYSALEVCIECSEGFFLKNATECQLVSEKAHCLTYSRTASSTICTLCQEGMYLAQTNKCDPRSSLSINISSCQELYFDQEKCKICVPGYIKTNDERKCLPEVEFCQVYESSSSNSSSHICNQCNDYYYYSEEAQKCVEGSIKNCKNYKRTLNGCLVCDNRYYLSGGTCKTHQDLVYCQNYSNTKKNVCSQCNEKTLKFQVQNTCLPVNVIDFCDIYQTVDTCQKCVDGYSLKVDKTCEQIPGIEFCLQKDGLDCIKCLPSKILQDGNCVSPIRVVTHHCHQHNVDGLIDYFNLKCSNCKEKSIPYDYKNHYLCYEENYIKKLINRPIDAHCVKFKQINNIYKCVACIKGKVLDIDNTCQDTCTAGSTLLQQSIISLDSEGDGTIDAFKIGERNVCGAFIEHCSQAAPLLEQSDNNTVNLDYGCIKCEENALSYDIVDLSRIKTILNKPTPREYKDQNMKPEFSPLSNSPARTCLKNVNLTLLGQLNAQDRVEHCELYTELTGYGLGCLKCHHGYYGQPHNAISNCEEYESLTKCNQCKKGWKLKDITIKKRCVPVDRRVTPHCIDFANDDDVGACIECEEGFYLDGTDCLKRTVEIQRCNQWDGSKRCVGCETGFVLVRNLPENNIHVSYQCKIQIPSCKVHQAEDPFMNNDAVCQSCIDGFYLQQNFQTHKICVLGKVEHCLQYTQDQRVNICEKCQNGYYKSGEICKKHYYGDRNGQVELTLTENTRNCDEFQPQNAGECKTCKANHLMFSFQNQCVPAQKMIDSAVQGVNQCLEYSSALHCKLCADEYRPVNYGQRCQKIPTSFHCLKMGEYIIAQALSAQDDANCILCEDGYLLINGQCKKWLESFKTYCLDQATSPVLGYSILGTLTDFSCNYCKESYNYAPVDMDTEGICLENQLLDSSTNVAKKYIENCLIINFDTATQVNKCLRCKEGFYINSSTDKCISANDCLLYEKQHIYVVTLDNGNYQIDKGAVCNLGQLGEQTKGMNIQTDQANVLANHLQSDVDNILTCSKPAIPVILNATTDPTHLLWDPVNSVSEVDFKPRVECISSLESNLSFYGMGPLRQVENCMYYQEQYNTAAVLIGFRCITCNAGYEGIVKSVEVTGALNNTVYYIDTCTKSDPAINYCQPGQGGVMTSLSNLTDYTDAMLQSETLSAFFAPCSYCAYKEDFLDQVSDFDYTRYIPAAYVTIGNKVQVNGAGDIEGFQATIKEHYKHQQFNTQIVGKVFDGLPVSCIRVSDTNDYCYSQDQSLTEEQQRNFKCADAGNKVVIPIIPNCGKVIFNMNQISIADAADYPTSFTRNVFGPTNITDNTGDGFQTICVQCLPKYKATYDNATKTISSCDVISNCLSSDKLRPGACTVCDNDYLFFIVNEYVDQTSCVKGNDSNLKNCYVADNSQTCLICKQGYQLDRNINQCLQVKAPQCSESNYNPNLNVSKLTLVRQFISYNGGFYGCKQCDQYQNIDFVQVKNFSNSLQEVGLASQSTVCLQKKVHIDNALITNCTLKTEVDDLGNSTPDQKNLQIDQTDQAAKCIECQAGYVLDLGGKCQSVTNLKDCLMAKKDSSTYCETCRFEADIKDKFISVAGVCQPWEDYKDCESLEDASFKTGARCLTCKDGFYLTTVYTETTSGDIKVTTTCNDYYNFHQKNHAKGDIQNCAQFDGDDERLYCIKCFNYYALLILDGDEKNDEKGFNRHCLSLNFNNNAKVNAIINDATKESRIELQLKTGVDKLEGYEGCLEYNTLEQTLGVLNCTKCDRDFYLEVKAFPQKNIKLPWEEPVIEDFKNTCIKVDKVQNCKDYEIQPLPLDRTQNTYQAVTYLFNHIPRFSTLKCTQCDPDYFLQEGSNSCSMRVKNQAYYENNCLTFEIKSDTCSTCKQNYFLSDDKISCLPAPKVDKLALGYLHKCSMMSECVIHSRFHGLNTQLESVLSCHECKNPLQIPFAAVSYSKMNLGTLEHDKLRGIREFKINRQTLNEVVSSSFCNPFTHATDNIGTKYFGYTNGAQWQNLPDNCGVGIVNSDQYSDSFDANNRNNLGNDATQHGVFCAACKPGYKMTKHVTFQEIVTACTVIANCQDKQAFNNCSRCAQGYAFQFENNIVNYDNCVEIFDAQNYQCLAWQIDDLATRQGKCIFCNKGHYLNRDNLCERIDPPACERGNYQPEIAYKLINLKTGLYLNSEGPGCNKCRKDFYGLFISKNTLICTESSYHISGLKSNSLYKNNCVNYKWLDEALLCDKCTTGFVPDEANGNCISTSAIQNCILAKNESFCVKCDDTTVLVNGKCQAKNIENCVKYTYGVDSNSVTCLECALNYYLEANVCKLGSIQNCEVLETNTVCNVCKTGFQLVQRNDGISYCYPIDQSLQCKQFVQDDFQKGFLKCAVCQTNNFVISTSNTDFFKTHCMRFFEIPNCIKYQINPIVADSSFACQECTRNFFLDQKECKVRTIQLSTCSKYQVKLDQCQICKEGYYLSLNGLSCIPYPIGTENCRDYRKVRSEMQCRGCVKDYWYDQNLLECIALLTTEIVENCLYHIQPSVCDTCDEGFLNINNECKKIEATNCARLLNIKSCENCPKGYGFVETLGVKNCEQQSVANCQDFNQEPPYPCLTCNQNYYLLDGVCTEVAIDLIIPHCIVNLTESTCKTCSATTALSLDKTKCLSTLEVTRQIDHNCMYSQVLETADCNSCKPGYVFDKDGNCQSCQVENGQRCYTCDPLNLKKCILCNPGFFHNQNGVCSHPDDIVQEETEGDLKNINDTQGLSGFQGVGIHNLFSLLLILSMF